MEFIPDNLEIESFKIEIATANDEFKISEKTKIEHKKIVGVFCLLKGGNQPNYNSKLSIAINSENLVSVEPFSPFLIEKTNSLSVFDSMWKVDKDINTSDISIKYTDGNNSGASFPYTLTLCLLCQK